MTESFKTTPAKFHIVAGVALSFNIPAFQQIWGYIPFLGYLLGIWLTTHSLPKARKALTAQLLNEAFFWLSWRFVSYSLEIICLCTNTHFFRSMITPCLCSTASSTASNTVCPKKISHSRVGFVGSQPHCHPSWLAHRNGLKQAQRRQKHRPALPGSTGAQSVSSFLCLTFLFLVAWGNKQWQESSFSYFWEDSQALGWFEALLR